MPRVAVLHSITVPTAQLETGPQCATATRKGAVMLARRTASVGTRGPTVSVPCASTVALAMATARLLGFARATWVTKGCRAPRLSALARAQPMACVRLQAAASVLQAGVVMTVQCLFAREGVRGTVAASGRRCAYANAAGLVPTARTQRRMGRSATFHVLRAVVPMASASTALVLATLATRASRASRAVSAAAMRMVAAPRPGSVRALAVGSARAAPSHIALAAAQDAVDAWPQAHAYAHRDGAASTAPLLAARNSALVMACAPRRHWGGGMQSQRALAMLDGVAWHAIDPCVTDHMVVAQAMATALRLACANARRAFRVTAAPSLIV